MSDASSGCSQLRAYQTLVFHLPEQQTSLVVFTNSDKPATASTTLGKAITEVISPDHVYQ